MADSRINYPLTDTQLAVYTYCKAHPEYAVYQISIRFGPYRNLDARRLKKAAEIVVNNHPILKIRIVNDSNGQPFMQRNDSDEPCVEILDDCQHFRSAISIGGLLYNIAIIDGASGCELIICVHHIIFDGYSMNVLMGEISAIYLHDVFQTEKCDFFQFSIDESLSKNTEFYQKAKGYFLQNFPPTSARTIPLPDCNGVSFSPSIFVKQLPVTLQHWRQICDQFGYTANVVSTTVFSMVLGCFCGENEARFSTVFHGRHGRATANTIGMLVKTIPVSATWNDNCQIADLMRFIRWQMARSMVHDVYPFSEIKKNCGGLDNVGFIYQGNTNHTAQFCGQDLRMSFLTPLYTGSSLSMELWHGSHSLEMTVEYDGAKFSSQLIENMVDAYCSALISIENATTIGEINFLTPEMSAKLCNFNKNATVSTGGDIIEMFAETVQNNASAVAVKYLDKVLSYRVLDLLTNQLANSLISRGVGEGSNVAIIVERSEMMVVLPLAVLKTGAAYVPLSSEYPEDVIRRQIEICHADIVLSDNNLDYKQSNAPLPKIERKNFAIFFTSGSTGTPKGVAISHQNVAAYCKWYHRFFEPRKGCVIAAYNNFSFDAFVTDVFPALTSGATVAIVPQKIKMDLSLLAEFCDANCVDVIDLPTQVGRIFAASKHCKTLRNIVLGGETLAPFKNCDNYHVFNQYGPTETTVAATIYELSGNETVIPIGKPLDCVKVYVSDFCNRLVPIGAIGEIWIAGAQVSDGYINMDCNTGKFVKNPYDSHPNFRRVFRTGDYGRWREDGNLELVGRRDGLVKIRGFRVEISELENVLKTMEDVSDAAATTFVDAAGSLQIAAFVVGSQKLDLAQIRQNLRLKLPPHVLPQSLQQIDYLPITPNGKVDRKNLPNTILQIQSKKIVDPKNELEVAICKAFKEVLDVPEISADDNFFEIGGTSISAMQVVVNLENIGIKIKYADIFERPTPQQLALRSADIPACIDDNFKGNKVVFNHLNTCKTIISVQPTHIVVTGVTGFFGCHLLKELLETFSCDICCVVRSKDGETAEERFLKIVAYYFGKKFAEKNKGRISIVDVDFTNPQCFNLLNSVVTKNATVIHCAAIVKHFAEKKLLQAVNVDAVKYLIDCCLQHDCDFVYISTLSAAVKKGEVVTEHTICPKPSDSVPYAISKWQAEQLAMDAVANCLNLKLIRLGNLAPRSTDGMAPINADENAVAKFLDNIRELGCYPESLENQRFDYTPVDHAARDVARLVAVKNSPMLFHVFDSAKVTVNEIVAAKKVTDLEFLRMSQQLPMPKRIFGEYFKAVNYCEWDNRFTVSILENFNF